MVNFTLAGVTLRIIPQLWAWERTQALVSFSTICQASHFLSLGQFSVYRAGLATSLPCPPTGYTEQIAERRLLLCNTHLTSAQH